MSKHEIVALVQEYEAIMAGAYPGDENKVLEKIQEHCSLEYAFSLVEYYDY